MNGVLAVGGAVLPCLINFGELGFRFLGLAGVDVGLHFFPLGVVRRVPLA